MEIGEVIYLREEVKNILSDFEEGYIDCTDIGIKIIDVIGEPLQYALDELIILKEKEHETIN